jgi:zinc D-Ala-D-Ala carboxypeptidase
MKISKHFTREEMACNCGCGLDSMDVETLMVADMVRDYAGVSITPSSAARCYKYNRSKAVGSNNKSQHPRCRALDLPVPDPQDVYDWLDNLFPDKYGFGVYVDDGFVHIDTKSGPARRWKG